MPPHSRQYRTVPSTGSQPISHTPAHEPAVTCLCETGFKRSLWIGYNVLDWFMRDMTTKELIIMADPNRPRHYEEEFKRQIVRLYENGKPSSQIRAEYGIPRSTLQRWVQGIRNSGSTRG